MVDFLANVRDILDQDLMNADWEGCPIPKLKQDYHCQDQEDLDFRMGCLTGLIAPSV
jgi:hypothetical protein